SFGRLDSAECLALGCPKVAAHLGRVRARRQMVQRLSNDSDALAHLADPDDVSTEAVTADRRLHVEVESIVDTVGGVTANVVADTRGSQRRSAHRVVDRLVRWQKTD